MRAHAAGQQEGGGRDNGGLFSRPVAQQHAKRRASSHPTCGNKSGLQAQLLRGKLHASSSSLSPISPAQAATAHATSLLPTLSQPRSKRGPGSACAAPDRPASASQPDNPATPRRSDRKRTHAEAVGCTGATPVAPAKGTRPRLGGVRNGPADGMPAPATAATAATAAVGVGLPSPLPHIVPGTLGLVAMMASAKVGAGGGGGRGGGGHAQAQSVGK